MNMVSTYQKRHQDHTEQAKACARQGVRVSYLRVLTFCGAVLFLFWGAQAVGMTGYVLAFLSFVGFLLSVHWHNRIKTSASFHAMVATLNQEAQQRFSGGWTEFDDRGDEFCDPAHPFTLDLQVFGPSSLFLHMSTAFSFAGRRRLASLLTATPRPEAVKRRQASVAELAGRLDFCQAFEARGRLAQLQDQDPASVCSHLSPSPARSVAGMLKFLWLFPLLPLLMFLGVVAGFWPPFLFTLSLTVQLGLALWGAFAVAPRFGGVEKAARSLHHYVILLRMLQEEDFCSDDLITLQKRLVAGQKTASERLRELSGIADLMAFRYSQPFIYHPINLLLLWDWHMLSRVEKWKQQSADLLPGYLDALAELEALNSLAVLARDHDSWSFPELDAGEPHVQAKNLGHPLINAERRIPNSCQLVGPGTAWIITGSNMSGKSTWLRTVGLNLVMAYAGAPVCATEFQASVMAVHCKMQVQDDLQAGISTFWAELERIKGIVDAAKTQKPLLFLLDEIFRGTNSHDRILATRMITKQLLRHHTIGLITTHDLDLASLEDEHDGVFNYHFTDRVDACGIHFDHRLRRGVSKSTNALALMNMIGLCPEDPGDAPWGEKETQREVEPR